MLNRGHFMIAFFDVLGFESRFQRFGLDGIYARYENLIKAVRDQDGRDLGVFGGNVQLSESIYWLAGGDIFMYMPTYATYASDSILLWSHRWFPPARDLTPEELAAKSTDPGEGWQYVPAPVDSFLVACCEIICKSIECAMPIRGALSIGEAILDVGEGIFLGNALIEAARLEKRQQFVGAGLCKSFGDPLIPKRFLLEWSRHIKSGGSEVYAGTVLDWPRHWRETRRDNASLYINALRDSNFSEYYDNTLALIDASAQEAFGKEPEYQSSLRKSYPQFGSPLLKASSRPVRAEIRPPVDPSDLSPADQIRTHMGSADSYASKNQWEAARESLSSALLIAESSGSIDWQIQVLANLGVANLHTGEREAAEPIFIQAVQLYNENYVDDCFDAVEIRKGGDVMYKRAEDVDKEESKYIVRKLYMSKRFSALFDEHADEAVDRFQTLAEAISNVFRNIAEIALLERDDEKAEHYLLGALEADRAMNFAPGVACTLARLGDVENSRNSRGNACKYWRQSLAVYEKLAIADHVNWIRWERSVAELQKLTKERSCPQSE